MTARDLHSNIKVVQHLIAIVGNNDTEGTPAAGIDTTGFDALEFIVSLGDSGDTLSGSLKVDMKIEHSDTDSGYAAVTSADDVIVGSNPRVAAPDSNGIFATVDAPAEDQTLFRIGYRGSKKFVRVWLDFTGTHTNGIPCSVIAILAKPALRPTLDA